MNIQLLPDGIEIILEFRGFSRLHGGMVFGGELNGEDFFQACRTLGEHHHAVGKTDGFGNIMSDKNSRLSLFFQDFSNVITYVQPCLVIKCGEWFVEKQKIRF